MEFPTLKRIQRSVRDFCFSTGFPLLVLGMGLLAQAALEFYQDRAGLGVALYLIALSGLAWAFRQGAWPIASRPAPSEGRDSGTVRIIPFAIGLGLALVAFLSFGGNRFTLGNLTLWWLALVFYLWGVEERAPQFRPVSWKPWENACGEDRFCVSRWHLVVLLSFIALVAFHFSLLPIPGEPTVDHAENAADMLDVLQGQWSIFFPRNTGREPLIMYWTVFVAALLGVPLSFWVQKLCTVLIGLCTLPGLYLLGKEVGGRRVGWLSMLFFGVAAWPAIIIHFGLRMAYHLFFTTMVLYHLFRGLHTRQRNDFLRTGFWLGLSLYGYTASRILPLVVLLGLVLYVIHTPDRQQRRDALIWTGLIFLTALLVFLPLLRYAVEYPSAFFYRAFTRVGTWEQALPAPWPLILPSNFWKALLMFNWDLGEVWILFVPHRPALDVVSGSLFLFGIVLIVGRYLRERDWRDLFLLLALLVLLLPSVLSLSFPAENPHPSRAGGTAVVAFILVALVLDSLLTALEQRGVSSLARGGVAFLLFLLSVLNNDRILRQFDDQYRLKLWNPCDYGAVIARWGNLPVPLNSIWVIPYPEWVDTRLPGLCTGLPDHDFGLPRDRISETLRMPEPKLFILSRYDASVHELQTLYPQGVQWTYPSRTTGRELTVFFVPHQ
ncbi:MAG: glycosyltransferase family 39 protein [Anaerolineae bacterium]|nr:glycosyltransferase family 39 protein [Anaerolineae bacterium]